MSADLTPITIGVDNLAYVATGESPVARGTGLQSLAVAQTEAQGTEMARSGRSFVGGMSLVAGAIVPVVDLPTTVGAIILFNSAPASASPPKHLVVKRISISYGSGTLAGFGSCLFGGVTPSKIATPLVANGATNFRTQCTRGTGTPYGLIDVAQTCPAGTAWELLGGIAHGAATTTSIGYTKDVSAHPFIVPPGFAFVAGTLGGLGTSAAWLYTFFWDEVEMNLP